MEPAKWHEVLSEGPGGQAIPGFEHTMERGLLTSRVCDGEAEDLDGAANRERKQVRPAWRFAMSVGARNRVEGWRGNRHR